MPNEGDVVAAKALPSKRFFVDMLVRDIELKDAILDLLDNCVDGILRSTDGLDEQEPYRGYRADIVIAADGFRISDNCGGIPYAIAVDKAFAIGRPDPITGDDAVATVGMYGIGMKRAIFKFGECASVRSFSDVPFEVTIDRTWLQNDRWEDLPMTILGSDEFAGRGTTVEVHDIYPHVQSDFRRAAFVDEVRNAIARQYSIIIQKGFEVSVSAAFEPDGNYGDLPAIVAEKFVLLASPDDQAQPHVAPYVYKGTLDGVDVEIYAGLYRELPDEQEEEREQETSGSSDDAGWIVACNDRVVIWKDRGRLTGWGEAGVPNFHGQFIAITGIVLLKSADPSLLPLTTTKRGIDAASDVYSKAKDFMREATKGLASFTNKWKKFPSELDQLYLGTRPHDLKALRHRTVALKAVHKEPTMTRSVPVLPVPPSLTTDVRISFLAPKIRVAALAEDYFRDSAANPASVGQHAFEREYQRLTAAAE